MATTQPSFDEYVDEKIDQDCWSMGDVWAGLVESGQRHGA